MRIGTLTFHRAQNFGAMLQAYALETAFSQLGADCKIIDYRCDKVEKSYKNFMIESKGIKGVISAFYHFPIRYFRTKKFRAFENDLLRTTNEIYDKNTIKNANEKFDTFVVGSDQVWNGKLTGDDSTYFLDFVADDKRKYSYAASLGDGKLSDENKNDLRNFSGISAREENTGKKISEMINREVTTVSDPVFLVEKREWEKLIDAITPPCKDYIFLYELHEKKTRQFALELQKKTGCEILMIPNDLRGGISAVKKYAPSVLEFLSFIYNAKYVVTDSFHVTAFSIIFNKDLYAVLKGGALQGLNSRIASILENCGLSDRMIGDKYDLSLLPEQIDYNDVNEKIELLRKTSIAYLKGIMEV